MPPSNWSHPRLAALSKPVPAWLSFVGAAGTFIVTIILMRWRQSMKVKTNQLNYQAIFAIVTNHFKHSWDMFDVDHRLRLGAEEVRALLEHSLNQARSNPSMQEELAQALTNQSIVNQSIVTPPDHQSDHQSVKVPIVVEMTELIRSTFDRLHNQYQRIFTQWLLNLDNIQAHAIKQSTNPEINSQSIPEKLSLDDHKDSFDSPRYDHSPHHSNNNLSSPRTSAQEHERRNSLRTFDWKTTCVLYGCLIERSIAESIVDKCVA